MKKFILFITLFILSACSQTEAKNNIAPSEEYDKFITLLTENNFTITETGKEKDSFNMFTAERRWVKLDDGTIFSLYKYTSSEDMEKEAAYISPDGFSISRATRNEDEVVHTHISWAYMPYFFKKDRLFINYAGEDAAILEMLITHYGKAFAGGGY